MRKHTPIATAIKPNDAGGICRNLFCTDGDIKFNEPLIIAKKIL